MDVDSACVISLRHGTTIVCFAWGLLLLFCDVGCASTQAGSGTDFSTVVPPLLQVPSYGAAGRQLDIVQITAVYSLDIAQTTTLHNYLHLKMAWTASSSTDTNRLQARNIPEL